MNLRQKTISGVLAALVVSIMVAPAAYPAQHTGAFDAASYVNPFIGTGGHGHTFPGATVPFGMVQLSPDNGTQGWDWCSGYNYSDSVIIGFSHTHLSGTGIGDLCDIRFMPALLSVSAEADTGKLMHLHSTFSHEDERAQPGYYSVMLKSFGIHAELTATRRAGFQKYTFPRSDKAVIVIDLDHAINWDRTTSAYLRIVNDSTVVGYRYSTGWARDQRVYFAAKFSRPFEGVALDQDGKISDSGKEATGKLVIGVFKFKTQPGEVIYVKTGISSSNIAGALNDLDTEIRGWDFGRVRRAACDTWRTQLGKIRVASPDSALKVTFYTALYHTMIAPNLFSDVDGYFKGADGKVHRAVGYDQYTVFSLWDTFRAEHPLLTLLEPGMVKDFVGSFLAQYREIGLLPVWELEGNETNTMIGYPAVPVIADAILKGIHGFNVKEAFAAMKKSAMQDQFGLKYYRQYGYVPANKAGESVSRTMEYSFDDWCIAQVAKYLHKKTDYNHYMKRSRYFKNLFDNESGFMRGKLSDGKWVTPFNPFAVTSDYTESNAWPYSFFAPQDPRGLIRLYGGDKAFCNRLDSLFNASSKLHGRTDADITGMVGQYAQGDEQSHHIAYLYDFGREPWKTQEIVRQVAETLYTDSTDGLCGNDDCGQMSAWYVFSSMGFYPVNPVSGIYAIGSPMFDRASIDIAGKRFHIIARHVSAAARYIQSAKLNGKRLSKPYITYKELIHGGTLEFEMGDKPNRKWGSGVHDVPPTVQENQ